MVVRLYHRVDISEQPESIVGSSVHTLLFIPRQAFNGEHKVCQWKPVSLAEGDTTDNINKIYHHIHDI